MFTGLQFAVLDQAEAILAPSEGYDGLCIDNLPNDQDIALIGFDEAVQWVVHDTVEQDGLTIVESEAIESVVA